MTFAPSYEKLTDLDVLRNLAGNIAAERKPFGFDVETGYDGEPREKGSLQREGNFLVAYQFTNSMRWARMVPLRFDHGQNCDNYEVARILWRLHQAKDEHGLPLGVAHGAIAELRWMSKWFLEYLGDDPELGPEVRASGGYFPVRSCTLIESFVEAENQGHGLKAITKRPPFSHEMRELLSLFPDGLTAQQAKCIRFNVLDPDDPEVIAYACEDAVWCLGHHLYRYPRVKDSDIYVIEMAVLPVIAGMADNGVWYDWALMQDAAARAHAFADQYVNEVLEDFSELAGEPVAINFASSKQLQELLYVKCGMPVSHRTKGGKAGNRQPSVDAKVALPELAKRYPAVAKYLNWKKLTTLCRNFLDIYEAKFGTADDGRTHPGLLQHGTITGRFACEWPNYQQSPKTYYFQLKDGTEFRFNFRDCIAAPPGKYILGFDYSQIELRVVAGYSGEIRLIEAFERGDDVHSLTASLMLGKPLAFITKADRDVGKTMNFALVYGMTETGLADRLGISEEEAAQKFTEYFAAYPAIKAFMTKTVAEARRNGFVTTWWGRKVRIWEYDSPGRSRQADGDRTAGNAPVQGSATGDYVKISMVRADRALKAAGLSGRVKLIMNIHDALEFEVDQSVAPAEVVRVLQPAVVWDVEGWPPMVAEWHIGQRWGSVVELDVLPDGSVRRKAKGSDGAASPVPPAAVPPRVPEPAAVPAAPLPVPLAHAGPPAPARGYPGGPARHVIVSSGQIPGREQAAELAALLRALPGPNTVELRFPGQVVPVGQPCGLTPEHGAQVSVILGGASVHYDAASVDSEALTAALRL